MRTITRSRTVLRFSLLATVGLLLTGQIGFSRVLDNFDDNTKTDWTDFTFIPGFGIPTESGGRFNFVLPPAGQSIFTASTKSSETFTLQEGRTIEFRVDLVTGNGADAFALLAFIPTGASVSELAGYGVAKSTTDFLVTKGIGKYFYNENPTPPVKNDNVTLVLSMTVKNGSVILNGKVLDKDANNKVIFEQTAVDTPAADVLSDGTDSPAAPYLGSGNFVLFCYEDNGATQSSYEVTFDNAEVYVTDNIVLDNFDDNTKTDWTDFTFVPGLGISTESAGRFNFVLPPAGQSIFTASTKTSRTFDLVEGERVEFRVDLVAGNGADAFALLAFIPTGASVSELAGYGVAKSTTDFLVTKGIGKYFYNENPTPPVKNDNVTLVLSMTVKNGSVILNGKVLDKDANNKVIFEQTAVDTPAADVLSDGTDSPPAPYLGSGNFVLFCYEDNGTTQASYELVYDNAEVSAPPVAGNTPPVISEVLPSAYGNFLPASTPIAFKATDDKALAADKLAVTLNGTRFTSTNGLAVAGTGRTLTASLGGLVTNVTYTAVLQATDSDGVTVSNVLYFDTFLTVNPVVEIENYNFGSGQFIDNPAVAAEGSSAANAYSLQAGLQGVDFNDTRATPNTADTLYRPNDSVRMRHSLDVVRQKYTAAGGATAGVYDYDVGDIAAGEFLNYTRFYAEGTYEIYLRQSYVNLAQGEAVLERVTGDRTQPNPATQILGSFLGVRSGFQYHNIPLTDGLGQNRIKVHLSGVETLRLRQVTPEPPDGGIFQNYFVFVPVPDTGLQRATVTGVSPAQGAVVDTVTPALSVTIQNRDTSVKTNTIVLALNGNTVVPIITADTNGAVVTYPISPLPPSGSTNTARIVFADSDDIAQTNAWSFVITYKSLDPANRRPGPGSNRGLTVRVVQAPSGSGLDNSLQRAEDQLAPNSTIPRFYETNIVEQVINQAQDDRTSGFFPGETLVPGLDEATNGTDDFAVEIQAWLELPAGIHRFGVVTDDGYKISAGASLNDKEPVLAFHNGGPANESFDFVVQQAGFYPFRMIWYQRGGNAYSEWFSINLSTGDRTLINDTNSPSAIKAFVSLSTPAVGVRILNPRFENNNFAFSFPSETGKSYAIQSSTDLSSWGSLGVGPLAGNGGVLNVSIPPPSAPRTFYRVQTQ